MELMQKISGIIRSEILHSDSEIISASEAIERMKDWFVKMEKEAGREIPIKNKNDIINHMMSCGGSYGGPDAGFYWSSDSAENNQKRYELKKQKANE